MVSFEWSAALLLVIGAAISDLRTRRIPNVMTFSAAAAGLLYHVFAEAGQGAVVSGGGWVVGALLFFPIFALRGMGAGDVKLLAAIGAWLGPGDVVWVALITAVVGGALGVIVAACHGYLRTAITNVSALLMQWRLFGIRPVDHLTLASHRGPRLAYAIPIAAGTMITCWLRP